MDMTHHCLTGGLHKPKHQIHLHGVVGRHASESGRDNALAVGAGGHQCLFAYIALHVAPNPWLNVIVDGEFDKSLAVPLAIFTYANASRGHEGNDFDVGDAKRLVVRRLLQRAYHLQRDRRCHMPRQKNVDRLQMCGSAPAVRAVRIQRMVRHSPHLQPIGNDDGILVIPRIEEADPR